MTAVNGRLNTQATVNKDNFGMKSNIQIYDDNYK